MTKPPLNIYSYYNISYKHKSFIQMAKLLKSFSILSTYDNWNKHDFTHCQCECRLFLPLWKTAKQFLLNVYIYLPLDSKISKEFTQNNENVCLPQDL